MDTDIRIELRYDNCYTAAVVNTTITLQCYPPDGVPEVRVSWYKNQVKLRQIEDPGIVFTQSKRVMRVLNLSLNDSGVYHCRANNGLGIIRFSENKSVNVQGEPSVGWYIASVCNGNRSSTAVQFDGGCGTLSFVLHLVQ